MIKQEIRSLIYGYLEKYSEKQKYHPRFIDAAIEEVRNQMLWELFAVDSLAVQRFVKRYGYTIPIAVAYEAATHLYYSVLPAQIVSFRDKASGVRRISTPVQGSISFLPMDSREMDLIMGSTYVDVVTSRIGYVVTDRVEYYNMSVAVIASGVRMDCIVPFSVYTDNETVLLPEFRDQEEGAFEDRVLKNLRQIPSIELLENTKTQETK